MIEISCSCSMKKHKAPVDRVEIGSQILGNIPEYLAPYHNIFMVCDENTYRACGERVEKILTDSHQLSHKLILPSGCIPGYETAGNILFHLQDPAQESDIFAYSPLPDFILGVGSGVINDSCRVVAYRLGIPYGICGTAPSMDGYASAGSPLIVDGTKRTIKGTTPRVIIADTDIMKDAPEELLEAGLGDMFGKYTALFDWELSHEKTGEYLCEEIRQRVLDATDKCLENGYKLKSRDEQVIHNIIDGLLESGIDMAYTNTSRPASGAEHLIGHVWEIEEIAGGQVPVLHGVAVCEGCRLDYLMIKKIYQDICDGKIRDEFMKGLIEKYMPYFDKVEKFCVDTNYPVPVKDKEGMKHAILHALTLRKRYTTLYYINDLGEGKLEEYADYAATELSKRV